MDDRKIIPLVEIELPQAELSTRMTFAEYCRLDAVSDGIKRIVCAFLAGTGFTDGTYDTPEAFRKRIADTLAARI
jgi:hypothetical protein